MRLNIYLSESTAIDPDEIDYLIKKECKPFLKAASGKQVFRGMAGKVSTFKGKVRQDRRPMNTPKAVQDIFDDVCKKKFGWKPRSTGLFVTGDKAQARAYGDDYAIYPIGDFKIIWSPTISDFYMDILAREIANVALEKSAEQKEVRDKIIKSYTDKSLKKAINSGQEIMISCSEYYAKAVHYEIKL